MDFVTKIKDAVVPDPENIPHTHSAEPESEIPGAFPDADDETLGRELEGNNNNSSSSNKTTQGHLQNVGTGNSGDAMGAIEEVRPVHLGNEGKTIGSGEAAYVPGAAGSGGIASGSGGNTSESVLQAAADVSGEASAAERAADSSRDIASQQPTQSGGIAAGSGGNTQESVLQAAAGLSGGASRQPQTTQLPTDSSTESSGGIRNGVFGAGSDDPLGERAGGLPEHSTQYRKGDFQNVLSGVGESGLQQGGIHNGVVGLGSQEEEAIRHHSLSNQGQQDK